MKAKKEIDPFSWDAITGEKYFEIRDILEEEGVDDMEKQVKLVAAILNKDEDEIYNLPIAECGELISRLVFLNKFDLIKNYKPRFIQLPNYKLELVKDASRLTVSQYIDYQQFILLPLRDGYDKILSIFLVPEGHKYNDDYDPTDVQKEIRENLNWREVQSLLNFFMSMYLKSLALSLRYFDQAIKTEKDETKKKEMIEKKELALQKIKALCTLGFA